MSLIHLQILENTVSRLTNMSATLTASISPPAFPTSKIPTTSIRQSTVKQVSTINELLICRSETFPDAPLVAYPSTSRGRADYVDYTANDLDRFADEAAQKLTALGLQPQVSDITLSVLNTN